MASSFRLNSGLSLFIWHIIILSLSLFLCSKHREPVFHRVRVDADAAQFNWPTARGAPALIKSDSRVAINQGKSEIHEGPLFKGFSLYLEDESYELTADYAFFSLSENELKEKNYCVGGEENEDAECPEMSFYLLRYVWLTLIVSNSTYIQTTVHLRFYYSKTFDHLSSDWATFPG